MNNHSHQLPVGTHAATFMAANHSHAFHAPTHVSFYATQHYRNAALLELADRELGYLSDALISAFGVATAARQVLISAETMRHAVRRRQLAAQLDADLVATRSSETLANPRYLRRQRDPRVFELIGYVPSVDKCLVLPLKLVRVETANGVSEQWWARSLFPFGAKTFQRLHAQGNLMAIGDSVARLPQNYARRHRR
jgi:hypothetical protein